MKNSKRTISQNQNDNYITKLKDVFEYYCQYGERLNSRILKSHGFIKLFRESGLMNKKLDTTRLEIIYKSINKNNQMNFDQFLNSLLKIAAYKYSLTEKKDIKNATQKIILEYLYPLYYTINSNTLQSNDLNNNINKSSNDLNPSNFENIIYTDTFKQILIQVVPILFEIYRTYFTNEISISDDLIYIKNTSLKNYFTLIKNLEIIPYLLSNSTCYQIYKYETTNKIADESIKNNQNFYLEICQKIDFLNMNSYEHSNKNIFGKYFIFFKFIRSLIKMSQITFEKIFNSKNLDDRLIPEEMFILFLQKIEQSEGFGNFTKINNISHNYKTSNIIPPNFRIKLDGKNEEKEEINDNNIILNNNEEKIDINKNIEQYEPKYINYINEVYGKDLLNLYKTIVNFGDQFNFQYMKSKAFLKFLSDSNLIKNKQNNFGIKLNEIDIFFIKLCLLNKNNEKFLTQKNIYNKNNNKNNNSTTVNVSYGEIDYPTFIIAIEILSRYLFGNLPSKQAIDKLIVEYILNSKELLIKNNKINEIEKKIENLKQLQNNEEIISFLQIIHKAFYPLFSFYTKESEGLMSLHTFMKFVKDFEIFPYLIGKAKLNSLFNSIAQYSSFVKKNESFIEHSLFVDLIALMALEMIYPEPEPSPVEKMMIFIEKISQSGGVGKIAMRTGNNRIGNWANFIDVFKTAYPSYFEENEVNDDNINNKDDFENFMKVNYEEDLNSNNNDNNENNINENNDVNNIINNENIKSNEIEIKENNF